MLVGYLVSVAKNFPSRLRNKEARHLTGDELSSSHFIATHRTYID